MGHDPCHQVLCLLKILNTRSLMTTSAFVNLFDSHHWYTSNRLRVDTTSSLGHSLVMSGATTRDPRGGLFLTGRVSAKLVGLVLSTRAALSSESISVHQAWSIKLTLFHSELFVSDKGSNLYSIDLRAGNILYGYKGLLARSCHVWLLNRVS